VQHAKCGFSMALNSLHITEKTDDFVIDIDISTDNNTKAENSTAEIYVDLNVTSIVVDGRDVQFKGIIFRKLK
jgi:hypothetical protein